MSKENPLKQLITACWTSRPRPSIALIAESRRPGLRAQSMWMLTARPSLILTSICCSSRNGTSQLNASTSMRTVTQNDAYIIHITAEAIFCLTKELDILLQQVLSNHFIWRKATDKVCIQREHILTLGCWEVGLGNALGHSSSFTRDGRVGSVGVRGWKLVGVGGSEAVEGDDSSSFWRSLILCSSSFRYSIASPRMEALSIYQLQTETISSLAGQKEKVTLVISMNIMKDVPIRWKVKNSAQNR